MNDFRDSLALDVMVGFDSAAITGTSCEFPIADAILRSPEMHQIKHALLTMSKAAVSRQIVDTPRQYLEVYDLPRNVVDWVLS